MPARLDSLKVMTFLVAEVDARKLDCGEELLWKKALRDPMKMEGFEMER
jgi:hypothetical protein